MFHIKKKNQNPKLQYGNLTQEEVKTSPASYVDLRLDVSITSI